MQTPIAAFIARNAMEEQQRHAAQTSPEQGAAELGEVRRPVRRRFAGALRRSADRLSPLAD
jgi:hypothetical protein